jgi:acetate kinase
MRKILLLNLGTTSFKCKLYSEEKGNLTELASAEIECVGAQESMEHLTVGDQKETEVFHCPNHQYAFDRCAEKLIGYGLFGSLAEIDAVCYKAVHGARSAVLSR